jgi:hypothetical protein
MKGLTDERRKLVRKLILAATGEETTTAKLTLDAIHGLEVEAYNNTDLGVRLKVVEALAVQAFKADKELAADIGVKVYKAVESFGGEEDE